MRQFWNEFKEAGADYGGVVSDDVAETVERATGLDITDLITKLTETTQEIDYARLWKPLGLSLSETPLPRERQLLGVSGKATEAGFVVKTVHEAEAGQWIGISPGDILIAIDGTRIKPDTFEDILSRYRAGDETLIHAFRDDALMAWSLLLGQEKRISATVKIKPTALGRQWLSSSDGKTKPQ